MEKNLVILDTSAYSLHLQGDETIKLALRRADEIVVNPVIPTNDLWIAASAMQHGLKVLTADAHFLKVQQVITEHVPQH
jgi:predicted nucleic acid-binding protein